MQLRSLIFQDCLQETSPSRRDLPIPLYHAGVVRPLQSFLPRHRQHKPRATCRHLLTFPASVLVFLCAPGLVFLSACLLRRRGFFLYQVRRPAAVEHVVAGTAGRPRSLSLEPLDSSRLRFLSFVAFRRRGSPLPSLTGRGAAACSLSRG